MTVKLRLLKPNTEFRYDGLKYRINSTYAEFTREGIMGRWVEPFLGEQFQDAKELMVWLPLDTEVDVA